MATEANLRIQVLRELGVLDYGQTAAGSSSEVNILITKYAQFHALYSEKNAVYWGASDEIPDEAADSVVYILADECKDIFSKSHPLSPQRRLEIMARRERAEKDLRLLNNVDYQPSPTPFEDF